MHRGGVMLGDQIRKYRHLNNLTQIDLANRIGVSRTTLYRWENNEIKPDMDSVENLVKVFGISVEELLCRSVSEKENTVDIRSLESIASKLEEVSGKVEDLRSEMLQSQKDIESKLNTGKKRRIRFVFMVVLSVIIIVLLGFLVYLGCQMAVAENYITTSVVE